MSRNIRIGLWMAFGAVALGLGVASAATRTPAGAEPQPSLENSGRLCLAERAEAAPADEGWHPSTLALVLASTPDPERLLASLEEQLEHGEESANPLALELEPDDGSQKKSLVRELWPRVTAAQYWLRPALGRHGHELVRCDDPGALYSLWQRNDVRLPLAPGQLRQRAWPLAALGVVRSADVNRLAARLRGRSAEPGSTIALVAGPITRVEGLGSLRDRAKKLEQRARRAKKATPALLALLADAEDSPEIPLPLGAADLAVVPFLTSLVQLSKFTSEVEGALEAGDQFVHRPEFEGSH